MKKIIILIITILVVITIFFYNTKNNENNQNEVITNDLERTEEKEEIKETNKYKVDIKGAVVNPGVYEIEENKRIIDVIELAGGLVWNANTSTINLSRFVEDEMVIVVYTVDEVKNMTEPNIQYIEKECNCPKIENDACLTKKENNIVNINTATKEEFMTLPKIGESKANDIIKYRESIGSFKSIDEIKNVTGIKDALFETIKDYITI